MYIHLNDLEIASLRSIFAKIENEQKNSSQEAQQEEGYRSILLSYNVLSESDFRVERQKELIKRYERAYKTLGESKFLKTIKRVNHMNQEKAVKNIKMYAITSLEKEIKEDH